MEDDLLTTVITDSPHASDASHSMLLETVSSLTLVPGLLHSMRLVFDGAVPNQTKGSHWKCQLPSDSSSYSIYKANIKAAIDQLPARREIKSLTVVDLPSRVCLAGAVRVGVMGAKSRFVAVLQNDLPLRRAFDLTRLLAIMDAHAEVQKVSFSAGFNSCYMRAAIMVCRAHRHLRNPSNATSVDYGMPLTPIQFWFDGNHIANAAHYRQVFEKVSDGGFMENSIFCQPWLNHTGWGTFLLGNSSDGRYSSRANARNMTFRSNPCMIA